MAVAATENTDELISQLASSEIDRLLAEADGNPAPEAPSSRASASTEPQHQERAALLEAAGFETAPAPSATAPAEPAGNQPPETASSAAPAEEERAALLHAAGFESPELHFEKPGDTKSTTSAELDNTPVPIYLKPLVWINLPIAPAPTIVRQVLGKVGLVTLLNALAVLSYVIFFRKH